MAFPGDLKNIKLQLKLMNYAEGLARKPRYHVRRISFDITILEDDGGTDVNLDVSRPLSAEDQEVLKWQPRTANWQNDFEVRDSLTNLSGRLCQGLCPDNSMGLSLFGKVTDDDTHQERIEPQSLPSYRHVSFCSVMLTKHSVPKKPADTEELQPRANEPPQAKEDVQLLLECDGLPEDRSCLRWRSHDYIKLFLSEAKPSYLALWVVQWDVVDMTDHINDGLVATGLATGLGINQSRPCLDPSTSEGQSDHPRKFHGVRFRHMRKSPYSAEVKPKGLKNKISVGCYQIPEAAALAVDAGRYYYDLNLGKLNFPGSLRFLDKIPPNLNEEEKKEFVYKQAHKLAELAEKRPSTGISETRSCNTNTGGFTSRNISSVNNFGARNMRPATNGSFAGLPIARAFGFATPWGDLQANLVDVWPSTSFGSGVLREPVARSSPEENLLLSTANNRFTTNSLVNRRDELEPIATYTHEAPFAPVRNFSSGEATNDFFNELDTALHYFNPLVAGSEQAESHGDDVRDMDFSGWSDTFEEGC